MKKLLSSGFFGLTLLSFCLPWVTVSCQQQRITTVTGIQMVTGMDVAEPGSGIFGGRVKSKHIEPNALAVVAVVAAVAAFFISIIAGGASVLPAIIGVLVAFALKSNLDQDTLKQGQGLLSITYESGFWAYILFLICGSLSNLIPSGAASEISRNSSLPADNLKKCPTCAESINFEALVCKHCGNKFNESDVKMAIEQKRKMQTAHHCPRCNMTYPIEETFCDVCRMELIKSDSSVNNQDLPKEKICPMCAETVKAAALVCKHCTHKFESAENKIVEPLVAPPPSKFTEVKSVEEPIKPSSCPTSVQDEKLPLTSVQSVSTASSDYQPNNALRFGAFFVLIAAIAGGIYLYKTDHLVGLGFYRNVQPTGDSKANSSSNNVKANIAPVKYCGVWEYDQYGSKSYFKITDVGNGKFRFIPGNKYEGNITFHEPMLTNASAIYLKYVKGKLKGKFISGNFYATHAQDFTYKITCDLKSDDKLTYSVNSSIRGETDVAEATKISNQ